MDKKFNNADEAIEFLLKLPSFSKQGTIAYKPGLDNINQLLDKVGNPHKKYPSIHIAGTNGKGSTSHAIASVLQQSGKKVGLYTSPHLKHFSERIKVNGQPIDTNQIVDFIQMQHSVIQTLECSFFEATTAMAMDYFHKEKVDIAVIETGMGGRLDSTNVIDPILSIITNIGYDHMEYLGDTLQKIAFEKAGIIKRNTKVLIGEYQADIESVFRKKSEETHSPLRYASLEPSRYQVHTTPTTTTIEHIDTHKNIIPDLQGPYQAHNLRTVISALEWLKTDLNLVDEDILEGLQNVKKNTGIKARWQILCNTPLIYCDSAHNVAGIEPLIKYISTITSGEIHLGLGLTREKNAHEIISLMKDLPVRLYVSQAHNPRAMPRAELLEICAMLNVQAKGYESADEVYEAIRKKMKTNDFGVILGSIYFISELSCL